MVILASTALLSSIMNFLALTHSCICDSRQPSRNKNGVLWEELGGSVQTNKSRGCSTSGSPLSIPRHIVCAGDAIPMCQVQPTLWRTMHSGTRKSSRELTMPHLLPGATLIGGKQSY